MSLKVSGTRAKVIRLPLHRRGRTVVRVACTAATASVIAAIVIQDHTSYLPMGIFNTGAARLAILAEVLLALAVLALLLQIVELTTGRYTRVCGVMRGVFAFVAILNVLLVFGDRFFVTGNPAGLLGQYYEVPSSGHEPVILKKSFGGAPRHSCFEPPDPDDRLRLLFLGDSYTEGSGRARECNYPSVVEARLRERWHPNARVVNAGVSGYGPVEALDLLKWLRARGCAFDAVVYNLVLENDFADNLPRTERRVVAGIISRFPSSWFLRTFHPLNMRTFRWAMILTFFARASTQEMLNAVTVDEGPCDFAADSLATVSPFLRELINRGLANTSRVTAIPGARQPALDAMREMQAVAGEAGVPFFVVVFPDRILVDAELAGAMGVSTSVVARSRQESLRALAPFHPIDLTDALVVDGLYREMDTHLSDRGNVLAGRYVSERLMDRLR